MKINRIGYFLLNCLLFAAILVGYYEVLELKSVVAIFTVPAFIISASLQYGLQKGKKPKTKSQKINNL